MRLLHLVLPRLARSATPRRGLAAALLLTLQACSSSGPPDGPAGSATYASATPTTTSEASASPRGSIIEGPGYRGVVIPFASVQALGIPSVGDTKLDGVWSPTEADVAAFESGLGAHLAQHTTAGARGLSSKLASYRRQWVGVTGGDKKLLFANFFCRDTSAWTTHLVLVDDGGDCYFQVFYDVASRSYFALYINGDA